VVVGEVRVGPHSKLRSPNHTPINKAHLTLHHCGWVQVKPKEIKELHSKGIIAHQLIKAKSSGDHPQLQLQCWKQ